MLCTHRVSILQQGLELVVLGECNYFQHCSKLRKNLQDKFVRITSNSWISYNLNNSISQK